MKFELYNLRYLKSRETLENDQKVMKMYHI